MGGRGSQTHAQISKGQNLPRFMPRSRGPQARLKRRRVDDKWEHCKPRHCHYPVEKRCCSKRCHSFFSPEHVGLLRETLLRSEHQGEFLQQRIQTRRYARRAQGGPDTPSEDSSDDGSSDDRPLPVMKRTFRCDDLASLQT